MCMHTVPWRVSASAPDLATSNAVLTSKLAVYTMLYLCKPSHRSSLIFCHSQCLCSKSVSSACLCSQFTPSFWE